LLRLDYLKTRNVPKFLRRLEEELIFEDKEVTKREG
jgi:hypothetical protein